MSAAESLALVARIACLGLALQTFQTLANWSLLRRGGILHWGPWDLHWASPMVARTRVLWGFRPTIAVLLLRGALATVGAILPYSLPAMPAIFAALLAAQVYHNIRFAMVRAGSDTMFLISLAAVVVGRWGTDSARLPIAALLFLAAELTLAYGVLAIAKARVAGWRDGGHLVAAFRNSLWRRSFFGSWLQRHEVLARVGANAVIGLHAALAISVFLPSPVFEGLLACGLVFHVSVALMLGLHGFVWAFGSAYPALVFVHGFIFC